MQKYSMITFCYRYVIYKLSKCTLTEDFNLKLKISMCTYYYLIVYE